VPSRADKAFIARPERHYRTATKPLSRIILAKILSILAKIPSGKNLYDGLWKPKGLMVSMLGEWLKIRIFMAKSRAECKVGLYFGLKMRNMSTFSSLYPMKMSA
jgi:hypothetical protein